MTDRVDVRFSLRGDSRPPLTHVGSDKWARDRLREEASRQLRDRFLASFNADEFWVWTIDRGGLFIWAFVNKEGLEKLRQHPDVLRMRLPELLFLGPELSPLQR